MSSLPLKLIDRLLRAVPGARTERMTLRELIEREAESLMAAHRAGRPESAYLIRGDRYRPGKSPATDAELLAASLTRAQARGSIVRFHWFEDEAAMLAHADEVVDPAFEAACDAIVEGDAAALRALLARDPALVHARSRFAHHQTLLQHVAANGIEHSRQWQSPPNAVEIAEILLGAGAEPDARCDSYGGGTTAMTLLVSSAHPAAAGVQAPLVEALCRGGAKPDGPDDDGMPLWTAIRSWYPKAVDALIRCGARVDNLLFAGAAGDLPAVTSYFDEAGRLLPERAFSFGRAAALAQRRPPEKTLHPRHLLEYTLHWAVALGRRPVVEYLLGKRPDLTVIEPTWNNTLLESAKYSSDSGMEALIAPLFASPR